MIFGLTKKQLVSALAAFSALVMALHLSSLSNAISEIENRRVGAHSGGRID